VVIGTDCIGSCISNYHTITATMPPLPGFMLIKRNNQRTQWSCVLRMFIYTVILILYGQSHENVTCLIRPDIRYTEIHVVKYYYLSPSRETTPLIRPYFFFCRRVLLYKLSKLKYMLVFFAQLKDLYHQAEVLSDT
jgi:hypothetical protein